jgi:hypothetical protein
MVLLGQRRSGLRRIAAQTRIGWTTLPKKHENFGNGGVSIKRSPYTLPKTAVHLVVLVRVSSAPVERVFSRLRLIVETLQQHNLHDAILLHLFVVINGKYDRDV